MNKVYALVRLCGAGRLSPIQMTSSYFLWRSLSVLVLLALLFSRALADGEASLEDKLSNMGSMNGEEDGDVVRQMLELNFNEADRERLRKALDDYARSSDPDHVRIQEQRRVMEDNIKARFLASDKDNDGTIDRQEATNSLPQIARHFDSMDSNRDGVISLDEVLNAQQRMRKRYKPASKKLAPTKQTRKCR